MDWTEFNWLYLGFALWTIMWASFLYVARKRRFGPLGLLIGVANMVVAMLHAVAPFRGALDPDYVGYGFLALQAEPGLGVTAIAGPVLLLSFAAALIAVSESRGWPMRALQIWSAALALLFGVPLLLGLVTEPTSFSINLGEYASIPWFVSFPLLLGLVVLPFILAVPWAQKRVNPLPDGSNRR